MLSARRLTLTTLAQPTGPTPAHMEELILGWDAYFERLGIPEARQMEAFDAIIRARVRAGSMSLVARLCTKSDSLSGVFVQVPILGNVPL